MPKPRSVAIATGAAPTAITFDTFNVLAEIADTSKGPVVTIPAG